MENVSLLQLAPLVVAAVGYGVRARTLARRGTPVPWWRVALFATGLLLLVIAFVPPLESLTDERFAAHMTQHLLLGDLAPLALLAGLTGPLLRPLLALPPFRVLRVLAHPLVALPLWVANLYLWHLPFAYEAAIENDAVHALEHAAFFTTGLLMWSPVLETLPAPAWFGTIAKLGYIVVVRIATTILGNVFLWTEDVVYDPYLGAGSSDQALAGALMTIEGSIVTLAAFAWLFLRLFAEGERRQELLESGADPRTVERAVRYGRAEDL
jgi:cytochrome c oxidase assembly factor CtaG